MKRRKGFCGREGSTFELEDLEMRIWLLGKKSDGLLLV